ncbi:LysR substrate-binding domain-containing protein [Aliagarivorans taiwanensis]|uniref:LysR substrate-binding domain-containing protein n=1 Tax=Aliagarivorans taiwanensis TaxID=561966 RepID=UPI000408899E|nr:LysR substrate-binding domain-containing protein [Aliagarivorans taiwanensis]
MRKYTLKQLSVFDAVASAESVSDAAKALSMTQSAVSMSLQQLEKQLDRQLFERRGNRLVLSHWGNWLRPRAKQLLQSADEIVSGLHHQHVLSGAIRVCASQTAAEHLLPTLISKIDSDFPDIHIELTSANSDRVIESLLDFESDLGVIEGWLSDDPRLHREAWLDDHLVIIASPHHPYAGYEQVSLSQLEQAQWILRSSGAGTRRTFNGAVQGKLETVNVWREYDSVAVIKALVANGPYLSCIPYFDAANDVEAERLVIINTPELDLHRSISFIWRNDSLESPIREGILREARRLVRRRGNWPANSGL